MTRLGNRSPRPFTFTVPVTLNNYATEIVYLGDTDGRAENASAFDPLDEMRVFISNLPASAQVELDVLMPDNTWALAVDVLAVAGMGPLQVLAGVKGRLRAKSGGTAGSLTGAAWWTRVS